MDAVAGLLDGPRARGAFLLRSTLDPPWCLRIEDEAPLTVVAVVSGEAWIDEIQLMPGDIANARGPEPQMVIAPGQICRLADGQEVKLLDFLGTRSWGNSAGGGTVLL